MQVIYEQQELTPADVERLKAARLDLQRQEEALEREVKDLSSEIWKKEIAYGRLHEQVFTMEMQILLSNNTPGTT